MVSKTTLNAKNLESLGAAHLAELLMDISEGNAHAKRRLRMELAGSESPDKLANEIRKRLNAIASASTNIGWRTLKGFRSDLNTHRRLIADQVALSAPDEALDLMWRFIALGDSVIDRTSDASGGVVDIFKDACQDIARLLGMAKPDWATQLAKILASQTHNTYGQNDDLIALSGPLIGIDGLQDLRQRLIAEAKEPGTSPSARPRPVKRWRKRVLAAAEHLRKRARGDSIRIALLAIADALGDVDAYVALQSDTQLPATAARIAERLLKAGRPTDALNALDNARENPRIPLPDEWQAIRVSALENLGRKEDAQAFRLEHFHRTLNAEYLRAYTKRLADFDDIEAEYEAFDFAKAYPDANIALGFLVNWPALDYAADLVRLRVSEVNGRNFEAITYAADRLSAKYPLAAMLLQRQIVEASLISTEPQAHATAVMPYLEAESLAKHVEDYRGHAGHGDWLKKLHKGFGHRSAFWKAVQ